MMRFSACSGRSRSAMLRVFAVCDANRSWQVIPGGMARVAHRRAEIAAMQRGGSSADVWVMTEQAIDRTTLLAPALTVGMVAQRRRLVTRPAPACWPGWTRWPG